MFVQFSATFDYTDPKTKRVRRFPMGWAGDVSSDVSKAADAERALAPGSIQNKGEFDETVDNSVGKTGGRKTAARQATRTTTDPAAAGTGEGGGSAVTDPGGASGAGGEGGAGEGAGEGGTGEGGGDGGEGGDGLDGMTKAELLAEAERREVDVKPAMNKAEIIGALRSVD